jgi:hypothetical protein
VAAHAASLPPVSSLFAAVLGVNPIQHLLAAAGALAALPAAARRVITGREFFPQLISQPFHNGLIVVFAVAAALAGLAAVASLLRGGRYVHPELGTGAPAPGNPAPAGPAAIEPTTLAVNGRTGTTRHITDEENDDPDHPGPQARPGRDRPAERDHGHTGGARPR